MWALYSTFKWSIALILIHRLFTSCSHYPLQIHCNKVLKVSWQNKLKSSCDWACISQVLGPYPAQNWQYWRWVLDSTWLVIKYSTCTEADLVRYGIWRPMGGGRGITSNRTQTLHTRFCTVEAAFHVCSNFLPLGTLGHTTIGIQPTSTTPAPNFSWLVDHGQ
jgi:hypothetical protein